MSQNHFTLNFEMKSAHAARAVTEHLGRMMPALFEAQGRIGTIHYSRFSLLNEKTLLFLGDFDGGFGQLMSDLALHAGSVFDSILQHVDRAPAGPVADHVDEFVDWAAEHRSQALNLFSAYPGLTVRQVAALTAGGGDRHPLAMILPAKSRVALFEAQLVLSAKAATITSEMQSTGTTHFAQFVALEKNQIGLFSVYDGSFENYMADLSRNAGRVFDLLLKFIRGAPPRPCTKYFSELLDFASRMNRGTIGFYQAYPGVAVRDIPAQTEEREFRGVPALTRTGGGGM